MEIGSPSARTLSLSKGEGRSDGPALVVAARNVAVVARGGVLGDQAVLDIARQRGRIAVLRVAETGTARGVETGDFAGRDGLGALAAELLAAGKAERARLAPRISSRFVMPGAGARASLRLNEIAFPMKTSSF